MREAAVSAGERLRGDIRAMGDAAVHAMEKQGLQVIRLDPATRAAWQSTAEASYPKLRGKYCPADLFDEVQTLRDAFRRSTRP
jgi:TRAP-type C4-dicarboxylate transport system substrate-binding protein